MNPRSSAMAPEVVNQCGATKMPREQASSLATSRCIEVARTKKGPKISEATNRTVNKPISTQASSEITPQADNAVRSHETNFARDKPHEPNETIQAPLPDKPAQTFLTACRKVLKTEAGWKNHQAKCSVCQGKPASNQPLMMRALMTRALMMRAKSKEGHEAEKE